VKPGVILIFIALWAPSASAQPFTIEQVVPPQPKQFGIAQVPAAAIERAGAAPSAGLEAESGAAEFRAPTLLAIPPRRALRGSIDADELARMLGAGRANSIDAAAAVALESLDEKTLVISDEPKVDDPAAAIAKALAGVHEVTAEKP
jgi:hypothetical protein